MHRRLNGTLLSYRRFFLIWLTFLKWKSAPKTGIFKVYVLFILSFVAKWLFLTLAQLTKFQGLGFGVALFVFNLTCIPKGK